MIAFVSVHTYRPTTHVTVWVARLQAVHLQQIPFCSEDFTLLIWMTVLQALPACIPPEMNSNEGSSLGGLQSNKAVVAAFHLLFTPVTLMDKDGLWPWNQWTHTDP